MTIQEIMDLPWNQIQKMNRADLAKITSQLASAANKRLTRLEKSGLSDYSMAYQRSADGGGRFSVKDKNINELRREMNRVRLYLNAKSSTVSGAKKSKEKILSKFDPDARDLTESQKKKLFKAYRIIQEDMAAEIMNVGSDIVLNSVRSIQVKDKRKSGKNIAKKFKDDKVIDDLYIDRQVEIMSKNKEGDDQYDQKGFFQLPPEMRTPFDE